MLRRPAALIAATVFAMICTLPAYPETKSDTPRKASLDDAVAIFKDRVEANPQDFISHTHLCGLYIKQAQQRGDQSAWALAEAAANSALAIKPDHAHAAALLAYVLSSQHRFAEALAVASAAHKREPGNITALAALADAQMELGRYDEVEHTLDELKKRSDAPPVMARLARLHELYGREEQALEFAEQALDQIRKRPGAQPQQSGWYAYRVGDLLFKAGKIDEAVELFEASLKDSPDQHGPMIALARGYQAQGKHDEAVSLLEKLVAADPAVDHLGELADAYGLAGRGQDAKRTLNLALEASRDEALPAAERRHVVTFLSDHGLDTGRAVQLAERDLKDRQDIGSHHAMAWALYQDGQHERAAGHMTEALRLGTRDPGMHFHAALIFAKAHRPDDAARHLEKLESTNPLFQPLFYQQITQMIRYQQQQ